MKISLFIGQITKSPAGIASNDLAGRANAWIKFPQEGRISHDPVNPGAADMGKGHDKIMVEVSDSRT